MCTRAQFVPQLLVTRRITLLPVMSFARSLRVAHRPIPPDSDFLQEVHHRSRMLADVLGRQTLLKLTSHGYFCRRDMLGVARSPPSSSQNFACTGLKSRCKKWRCCPRSLGLHESLIIFTLLEVVLPSTFPSPLFSGTIPSPLFSKTICYTRRLVMSTYV